MPTGKNPTLFAGNKLKEANEKLRELIVAQDWYLCKINSDNLFYSSGREAIQQEKIDRLTNELEKLLFGPLLSLTILVEEKLPIPDSLFTYPSWYTVGNFKEMCLAVNFRIFNLDIALDTKFIICYNQKQ